MIGIMGPGTLPEQLHMMITTDVTANIRLVIPYLSMDTNYTLTYHMDIPLPTNMTHMTIGTERKGIEILSDVPVTVTIITGDGDRMEVFLALPTDTLSTKYIAASYTPFSVFNSNSEFLIVGAHVDVTNITISLPLNYKNIGHYSATLNVHLQKYQTYQFQGPYDVSGAIITSDLPIVVFSGSQYSQIPVGKGDYQYLVEQLIPTKYWENTFIVPSIYPRWGYIIKIFATEDNTHFTYSNSTHNNSAIIHEHTHETLQFGQEPTVVIADKPINIIQYCMDIDGSNGDPFMTTAQAVTQFQTNYVFRTQPIYNYRYGNNTLAVTIKSTDVSGLMLDGDTSVIHAATMIRVPPPMEDYTALFFNISSNANHVLQQSSNQPFGAVLYKQYTTTAAYGYPLSLTFKDMECQRPHPTSTSTPSHGQGQHPTDYPNTGSIQCFGCDEMSELKYCDGVQTCATDDVCYVQSYFTNTIVKHYRSGCISRNKCNSVQRQGHVCLQCCNGSYCNTHGCGDDGILGMQNRGPICFDCKHIGDPSHCQQVIVCPEHQVCEIEKYSWASNDMYYSMGCSDIQCTSTKRSQHGTDDRITNRNVPICNKCCSTDFCNSNCTGNHDFEIVG